MLKKYLIAALISFVLCMVANAADAPADLSSLKPSQSVLVREGDTWTKATFLQKEGRRYQIKYQDGSLEWVYSERLKLDPAAAAPDEPAPGGNALATPADPSSKVSADSAKFPAVAVGSVADVKVDSQWRPFKVLSRRADWYLVEEVKWPNYRQWVEPWRVRKSGSAFDYPLNASQHSTFSRNNEDPPTTTAGSPPPEAIKALSAKYPKIVDPKGGKLLAVVEPKTWSVRIRPTPPSTRPTMPAVDIDSQYRCANGLLVFPTDNAVFVGNSAGPSDRQDSGPLVRIDRESHEIRSLDLQQLVTPLAVSPSGKFMAGRAVSSRSRLDIYKVSGATAEPLIGFLAIGRDREVSDVHIIDDQFLLVNSIDEVDYWNYQTGTCLWRVETTFMGLKVSADRKWAVMPTRLGLTIIEIATGRIGGVINAPWCNTFAISPSGRKLFAYGKGTLTVFDLETGASGASMSFPDNLETGSRQITALTDDCLFFPDCLFSVSKQAIVVRFKYAGALVFADGHFWRRRFDFDKQQIESVVLPTPQQLRWIEETPDPRPILKRGSEVRIDIQSPLDVDEKAVVTKHFATQLEKGGIEVSNAADMAVVVRTGEPTTETIRYRKMAARLWETNLTEDVTVTRAQTTITIEIGGKILWMASAMTGNDPGFIVNLEGNQTAQDVADSRKNNFGAGFMKSIHLPLQVVDPTHSPPPHVTPWPDADRP